MYIDMIQAMKHCLQELNQHMARDLGTEPAFPLDQVPPDDVFTRDMLETLVYTCSDLAGFHTFVPAPATPDTGAGAAGLTYYVNLAMIIGSNR